MRWVTLGQSVPGDIRPAQARVLSAFGLASSANTMTYAAA
jgi:flagellar biosynthesis GTPase FlhF